MLYPFWSKSDRRIRALWRILLQIALAVGFIFAITIPVQMIGEPDTRFNHLDVLNSIGILIAMSISIWLMAGTLC